MASAPPLAPRPQAPLPAARDQLGSGPGKLRPEPPRGAAGGGSAGGPGQRGGGGGTERAAPPRPAPSGAGRALPAGGLGAPAARGWVPAPAPPAPAPPGPVPSPFPSSFHFWPPPPLPPPPRVPSSAAPVPARRPAREGAAAGGGDARGPPAAPVSSGRGGRRLSVPPALRGWLLPARAGPPLPPPLRLPLPLGPARRAGSPGFPGAGGERPGPGPGGQSPRRPRGAGFALAAAALLSGADMDDGPSSRASCFRRLTECFLSPSKCRSAGRAGAGFSGGAGHPGSARVGRGPPEGSGVGDGPALRPGARRVLTRLRARPGTLAGGANALLPPPRARLGEGRPGPRAPEVPALVVPGVQRRPPAPPLVTLLRSEDEPGGAAAPPGAAPPRGLHFLDGGSWRSSW